MVFQVHAYVANRRRSFVIEADDAKQVPALLFERTGSSGTTILSVTPIKKKPKPVLSPKKKVTLKDMELLCRQLCVLISSGMTILESIRTLTSDRMLNKQLKDALTDIALNIRSGFTFASSLKGHPEVFNSMFCSTIEAAESSGRLEDALLWLADSFAREQDFKNKMRQTLTYPIIVIVFAIIITLGLFTFVVPKFTAILTSGGIAIPMITRIMIVISHNIFWIAGISVVAVLTVIFIAKTAIRKNEEVAVFVETKLIKIPVIGEILMLLTLSRTFWLMAMLLRTGINLLEVLDILIEATNYISLKREFILAKVSVEKGNRFAAGFDDSAWVRPIEQRMLYVGEQSGSLDKMAEHAATLLEKEADIVMNKLPPLIETSTTVMVGIGVLMVLLSLFLPMVSIYQTVK